MQILAILVLLAVDLLLFARGLTSGAILLGLPLVAWASFIGIRKLLKGAIWRLRNRLMVTYVFIGAVPILLMLALAYFGTWVVVGQLATYLINSELNRKTTSLESPARFISELPAEERPMLVKQLVPVLTARHPGFEVLVTGPRPLRYPEGSTLPVPPADWSNFTGVIERDGHYYCLSVITNGNTRTAIAAPLTREVMENLVPGIGTLSFFKTMAPVGSVPPPQNVLDFEFQWASQIDVTPWNAPARKAPVLLSVDTRASAVFSTVFGGAGGFVLDGLLIIAALLAIVELVSVVVGASMTRKITGAVHNLYAGTQRIALGNFAHRIPASGHDQLADLGRSFNQMTEQLEQLVLVAKEKERLQSELTIASEVQNQLFPRVPPSMRTIKLMGTCEPARSVSGDYYDYLCLPDGNLAFAIGDVAGKGISAALLMASIQSIMRTQLAGGPPSPAKLVAQLNKQLHENTAPEKYATFFFALYDENSRVLTYTNAGHLPPLIVCGGNVKPLNPTGTVVGLFPIAVYEQENVPLHHDDLLIAYTDGITEPENAYGEEFGSDRLAEVVLKNQDSEPREIVARVMEAVKQWSHSPELPDDMTVLIARGIA